MQIEWQTGKILVRLFLYNLSQYLEVYTLIALLANNNRMVQGAKGYSYILVLYALSSKHCWTQQIFELKVMINDAVLKQFPKVNTVKTQPRLLPRHLVKLAQEHFSIKYCKCRTMIQFGFTNVVVRRK